MKKLLKFALTFGIAVSMTACSSGSADAGTEAEDTPVEEKTEITEADIEAALAGTWDMPDGSGSLAFDNGTIVVMTGGQTLTGTYTINLEESNIHGSFKMSDGTVGMTTPFTFDDGVLTIYNNNNVAFIKK